MKALVIDLDSTILYSAPTKDFDFKKNKNKVIDNFSFYNMDDYYLVFERPHLQKFLDYIFNNFTVIIWTAASRDYCLFVIRELFKDRIPHLILFDKHCKLSEKIYKGQKDLRLLSEHFKLVDQDKVFIVDDYDHIKEIQPDKCLQIKPFVFEEEGSEKDTALLEMMGTLKEKV